MFEKYTIISTDQEKGHDEGMPMAENKKQLALKTSPRNRKSMKTKKKRTYDTPI
jgi:hypothetical protein